MTQHAFPYDPELRMQGENLGAEIEGRKQARGMTLRDYFAAKAMQGMAGRGSLDPRQATPEQRARLAYIEADAMLKEREK